MFDHTICDITYSCSFSYLSILTARADLFLEYVILSHAFQTAKFELDNGRHFHSPITVNLVHFNGNYLVPLIRKSPYHKVLKGQVYVIKRTSLARM